MSDEKIRRSRTERESRDVEKAQMACSAFGHAGGIVDAGGFAEELGGLGCAMEGCARLVGLDWLDFGCEEN